MKKYNPKTYWTDVAERIEQREKGNIIAGDDEPYYRYKRKRFLQLLDGVDTKSKSILEIGHGPGGNLDHLSKNHNAEKLTGVDISETMHRLAKSKLSDKIGLELIDGESLPFSNEEFDIVFSATVLQHNTDEDMLKKLIIEMARVSNNKVVLFEKIENPMKGTDLCMGRPVEYYNKIVSAQEFQLDSVDYLDVNISYYVSGAIRKGLNPSKREEGQPLNGISIFLQNITLPITKQLDKIFKAKRNVARLVFKRIKN
jgi:ubiquinone/menaquinone biosynthesis C-methylase UbiE